MNQEPSPAQNIEWQDLHKHLTLADKKAYVLFLYARKRVPEDLKKLEVFGFQNLIWQLLPNFNSQIHPKTSDLAKTLHIPYTKPAPSPLLLFVWHETLDLSESKCVFVYSDDVHAKSLDFGEGGNFKDDTRSCDGNLTENSMQHLVDRFCQHLDCSRDPASNAGLDEEETLLAGFLLQHLLKAWSASSQAFDPRHKWPFGIKGVKRVARETCLTKFTPNVDRAKSSSKEPVNLIFHWGQGRLKLLIEADISLDLRERGFFKFIVHPYPTDETPSDHPVSEDSDRQEGRPAGYDFPDFGLFFMLQHTDTEFVKHFVRHREAFTNILSLASSCFLQSLGYMGSHTHLTQRTTQQEERRRFLEVTYPVADNAPSSRRLSLAIEASLLQQLCTGGDIITPPRPSESQQSATTSSTQHCNLPATSESSSVASAVSSKDTSTTIIEEVGSDKDCPTPKGASSSPKPLSPIYSELVPALTSVSETMETENNNHESVTTVSEDNATEVYCSTPIYGTEEEHTMPTTQVSRNSPEEEEESEIEATSVTKSLLTTDLVTATRVSQRSPESKSKIKAVSEADSPATQSSQRSPELKTEMDATLATESPHLAIDSTVDTASSHSLAQKYPALPQTSITVSTPSSTRFRGTREVITIMSPIHEEESAESITTGEQVSQASVMNTDLPAPRRRSELSTPSLSNEDASQSLQTPRRPVSSSTSQQAANFITARIQANPGPRQSSLVDRPARPGKMAAALLSSPPLFSYNQPHRMTNCWLQSCGGPTMSSDNRTVACPRCGDHSYVRYCCSTHLLSDMREHYINHCGRRTNLLVVDENTMSPLRKTVREWVSVDQEDHDSVERHRQALYHAHPPESETTNNSTRPPSDYYVFSDADRFDATGLPVTVANLYDYRGTGSIAGRVRFNQSNPRKEIFQTLLKRLLGWGVSAGTTHVGQCRLFFRWVKENLVGQNQWTEIMITRMCLAMQLEFGWRVDVELRD